MNICILGNTPIAKKLRQYYMIKKVRLKNSRRYLYENLHSDIIFLCGDPLETVGFVNNLNIYHNLSNKIIIVMTDGFINGVTIYNYVKTHLTAIPHELCYGCESLSFKESNRYTLYLSDYKSDISLPYMNVIYSKTSGIPLSLINNCITYYCYLSVKFKLTFTQIIKVRESIFMYLNLGGVSAPEITKFIIAPEYAYMLNTFTLKDVASLRVIYKYLNNFFITNPTIRVGGTVYTFQPILDVIQNVKQ